MHTEDLELARNMGRGKDPAFRLFFDRYFPRIYRFCLRRLDEFSAEEVSQIVLINAMRKIEQYRGEASLFTWLCQIARHEISAHYRARSNRDRLLLVEDSEEIQAELESLSADPDLTPESMTDRHQGQAIVQMILDHLPGDYGQLLERKYMQGFSVTEIAQQMSITPTAVQSMLARARVAFRNQYEAMTADVFKIGNQADPGSP